MLVYGFRLSMQQAKQVKVKKAFEDAETLLEKAQGKYDANSHKSWLGASVSDSDVKDYTDRMVSFLEKVNVAVERHGDQSVRMGSFAYSKPIKFRGNKDFGDDYESTWGAKCRVWVCDNFYDDLCSRGERAHSLIHEITHLALATNDIGTTSGGALFAVDKQPNTTSTKDFYGADHCVELLTKNPDLACKNAENWAYYFLSYRGGLNWSKEDQKYLTAKECKQWRGKRF